MGLRAAAAAVLLAGAVSVTEAKGTGLPTRAYARPNNPSSAYKYAGAGLIGGAALGYWAGGVRYSPRYSGYRYGNYNQYRDNYDDDDDASWRENYGRGGRYYRNTNCDSSRSAMPRPEDTEAWVWVQHAVGTPRVSFKSVEFEVDLFRDLAWRSPCNVPTQVIVSRICSKANTLPLTEAEMNDPRICTYQGGTDSVHEAARRRLLQQSTYTIVEFAVGVNSGTSSKMNDMLMAVKESLADPNSGVHSTYNMQTVQLQAAPNNGFIANDFQEPAAALVPGALSAGAAALAATAC